MASYHVTCVYVERPHEERKKKLSSTGRTRATTQHDIMILFAIPADREIILQVFDEDFGDWLDVDDETVLPEKGKLKVTVCAVDILRTANKNAAEPLPTVPAPVDDIMVHGTGCIPTPYILCRFPADVQLLLDSADPALATNPLYRKKIRKALSEDMVKYTLCPSSTDYNNVCCSLVRKYPFLSDKVNRLCVRNATAFRTWKEQLRNDFKNRRRSLTSLSDIQALKEKFGRKRPRDQQEVKVAEELKRRKSEAQANCDLGEDEGTQADHIKVMKAEMSKLKPNMALIDERMRRTFPHRRHLIETSTVDEVLGQYPALSLEEQVLKDFERGQLKDCCEQFQKFWTDDRITVILQMESKKKTAQQFVTQIGTISTVDLSEQRYACALMCLPVLLREKFSDWVVFDEVVSYHPCVKVAAGAGGLFDSSSTTYEVYLDRKSVFRANRLSSAVIGMFALYFVFGVHYPAKLLKTCTFVSSHILGYSEPQLPSVQALFNCLVK